MGIYVTKPTLPDLAEYSVELKQIWDSGILTNGGSAVTKLEAQLSGEFRSDVALVNNGTVALSIALAALGLRPGGEVITTPFTFIATSHVILQANLKPVFVDIDPHTLNIDPKLVELAINKNTVAILAVHVFGTPAFPEDLQMISTNHSIPLIYDAAHAFGVEYNGRSVFEMGDISTFSFHATKVFSTAEGGAISTGVNLELGKRVRTLRNFGIEDEERVSLTGTNGKMSELSGALGLVNLKSWRTQLAKRAKVRDVYNEKLRYIKDVRVLSLCSKISPNHSYYPVIFSGLLEGQVAKIKRTMESQGVFPRRYFYPLTSSHSMYLGSESSKTALPIAFRASSNILCLPFYSDLTNYQIEQVVVAIKKAIDSIKLPIE